MPRISPSRGTHVMVAARATCRSTHGRLHRPGRRGADDLRPALVRADPDRHHRQRLRRRHRARRAERRATSTTCSTRSTRSSSSSSAAADLVGAYAGRAAADLDRRPAEVGRHLAQGRAVRDLLGDADDHRRQADHLAADGEAGRRPDGRARGPRGALPHRRDPARDAGRRGGPRAARRPRRGDLPEGALEQLAFRYGHAARNVLELAGERPELARADRRGPPRPARRGGDRRPPRAGAQRRRRAAAPHPARDPRRAAAARRRGGARRSPRRSAASWAGRGAASSARPRPGSRRRDAEGVDPAGPP